MRPKSLNWFLLVSLFLGSVPGLFSQQPDTSSTIHSTTRLVEVDVIVTDKTQPVSDLKASDFTVFEDGKPQKLSVFSFESVADVAAKSTSPPPSLRPGIFTNRPEYHAPAGPLVILLMDGLNTPINQGIYVRKQILKYLTDLKTPKSGTAVLVLANDLIVLQDFTTDPQLLIAAAQKYKQGRTAADVETPAIDIPVTTGPGGGGNTGPVSVPSGVTGDFADTNLPSSQDGSFAGLADLQNRFEKMTEAQEQGIRIRATLDALRTIARAVSGYPGRKSLLWFSGSFPLNLAFNERNDMDYYKSYREELHQVSSMLSDSKVAVYPIEAGGLSTGLPASDITTGSPGVGNKSTAINPSLADDTFGRFNNQLSGDNLAHDTGGLVFRNTNDLNGALQAAIKDSQSYYVLGYYPEKETWDGKHHKIKVTVADKKLKVRTRTGYYAVDPGKQVGLEREPLISSPLRTLSATGVLFYSHVVPPKKAGDQTTVEILADANTLSFVPGPNSTFQPDVDFQVGAFSPDGKTADLKGKHAQGNIPKDIYDQLLQHGMGANIDLTLKPGQYLLRVAIRDNRTGQVGTLDVPLKVNE